MKTTLTQIRTGRGYSIIEVLVAALVLSIGLLGVAKLNTTILANSVNNKANSEAVAIASSRLEAMRNYTGSITNETDFYTTYAATAGFTNDTVIEGNISQYTRSEEVVADGDRRSLAVQVTWTDETGENRTVVLDSEIAWQNPRSVGDFALANNEPLVDSATGRAFLGEGTLDDYDNESKEGTNNDGTELYDLGDGNLGLVSGNQVVLTLENACDTSSCTQFVTISGRIYIDTATQNNLDPGQIFVQASDAAFCQRYFIDSNNATVEVTNSTTSVPATSPAGDYDYFDYTCYIGGGWHGNIGILLDGGVQQGDKMCMGNPVSANQWEQPVISLRRSYRGMLYKIINGAKETFVDSQGVTRVRYYTQGLKDAAVLPAAGEAGHDYVVSSLPTTATSGDNCITLGVMIRPDSQEVSIPGDRFDEVPTDFVCFNEKSLLDDYDPAQFGADTYCPYDPTDPPVTAYTISGLVEVKALDDSELASITVDTSDGPGNCVLDPFKSAGAGLWSAGYTCTIFDWGNGWDGYVDTVGAAGRVACNPQRRNYSAIQSTMTGQNVSCLIGNTVTVKGSVISSTPKDLLAGAILSDGGSCTIAADGLSYTCQTNVFGDTPGTFTGWIAFSLTSGVFCPVPGLDETTGIATFTGVKPGDVVLTLVIASQSNKCPI